MDSLSNKVLITGIGGFTGKYLAQYFSFSGYEVFGIGTGENPTDSNIFNCDLRDVYRLKKIIAQIQPNIIIHLAAISFVGHSIAEDFYSVNVIGTENLLSALKKHGKNIQKVILASSATVYGHQEEYELLSETQCPNPNNHYSISKLSMEQIAKTYFTSLPIIITRPFNYTAPGQHINFVIPKITNAFREKKTSIELGNTNVFREYNAIDFVTECYFKLATGKHQSEIVNICTGKTHSLEQVIQLCSEITNHKLKVEINPKFVRKNDIQKLSGNPQKLNKMIEIDCNSHHLKQILESFF